MAWGFVYVLGHHCMPGVYKVGFTERSPHARMEELSRSTSIPCEFNLICYAEYENAREVEQEIHSLLNDVRVSPNREFFKCDLMRITTLVMSEDAYSQCEHGMYPALLDESRMYREMLQSTGQMTADGRLTLVAQSA